MERLAWVTGAGGLIGSHLVREAAERASAWRVRPLTREHLDLCDTVAVTRAFVSEQPLLVIHCAALSKSPECERSPDLAWRVNFQVTQHLAQLSADIPFFFFSTDLVFDGQQGQYTESAAVHPLSVYGKTKAAAETVVLANPLHTVVRTSLNAGTSPSRDRGCDEQLRLLWRQGHKTRLFTDEFRSPIPAASTARAVWEMVGKKLCGLYHLAGAERLSRWTIGELVANRCPELHPQLEPASLREYAGPPRAPDTSLDCSKLQMMLSFPLPGFRTWINSATD